MRRRNSLGIVLGLMLVSGAASTFAQTPIDPLDARDARRIDKMEQVMRELRAIVFQGRDSGKPVVIQPAETDYQLQEITRRLTDLQASLTRLTGDLEVANHALAQSRQDLQALQVVNRTLTTRVQVLEQAKAEAEATRQAADQAAQDLAAKSPADVFTAAKQAYSNGDYPTAESGFGDYVSRFSDTPRSAEARYWLGKSLSMRSAHADAATALIGAIRGWPQTPWAPDAVVELSRALVQLRKGPDACRTLDELTKRYPKASASVQSRATSARAQAKCPA